MLNWYDYRNQILAGVGEIGKLSPDTVKGYMALGGAGAKTGHLDAKTRELIALAVAITLRCDGCIAVHTAAARKLGANNRRRSPKPWGSASALTPARPWCTLSEHLTHLMWQPEMFSARTVVPR